MRPPEITARARSAEALAEEILRQSSEDVFGIDSEHQLCRRFNVSRVTVRLALSDLEARGLIFRRHGKGTFAYGRLNRVRRSIGILLRTLPSAREWPVMEIIRGFHHGAAALPANVLLMHAPPKDWASEMAKGLGGLFLFPSGLTQADLDLVEKLKVPTLIAWEANLKGRRLDFGHRDAARIVAERMLMVGHEQLALLTGSDEGIDTLKREGIILALKEVGLTSQRLAEYSMPEDENSTEEIVAQLIHHKPRITAVIATDDSRATRLVECIGKNTPIRVPQELSVASLERSPIPGSLGSKLSTAEIDYFEGGKRAAETLIQAFLTGADPEDIVLKARFHQGCTVATKSAFNFDMSIWAHPKN